MKKENLTGIIAITSFATLVVLLFIINSQAEMVKALYVKLAMVNLTCMVVAMGIYLMDVYCKETNRTLKISVASLGALLAVLSFFICFDVISFLRSWNWLVSGGILFILLVQLQLLNWGKWNLNIVRFSTLFIILSDLFLIFFFIAKWRVAELGLWINLAAIISIVLTATSLYFLKRKPTNE